MSILRAWRVCLACSTAALSWNFGPPAFAQTLPIHFVSAQNADAQNVEAAPGAIREMPELPDNPESILGQEVTPIDLENALRLAGVQNPELRMARQRVTEAAAIRQYMAAQILPNL